MPTVFSQNLTSAHLLIFVYERTDQVEHWNNKVCKYAWVEDKKLELTGMA